jgi:predicted NAD-dependent protein-ADP-ribosyltransferase YbiA (DUF1768 family)
MSNETLKPLNVWSRSDEELGRWLSNFAHTPFVLDGVEYASIEAFYAMLMHRDEAKRARIARMWGVRAKHEHPKREPALIHYRDETFAPGSPEHLALIKRALRAKLDAHPDIAAAFVATSARPLTHETGYPHAPDAVFPAHVFCRLLTELRDELSASFRTDGEMAFKQGGNNV